MSRYAPLLKCQRHGCRNLVRTNKPRPCNVCRRNEAGEHGR